MNKILIFLFSLCAASLEAANITNWGAQLPTMVPASGDAILMQKGGVTYYFTPVQLATFISTNLSLGTTNAIPNINGRGTNTTFAATTGLATNLWQLLGTNGLPLVFVASNQVMTVSNTLVVYARPQSTTTVPLTIAGSQGQDGNLLNFKDYLGNILFAINYDGQLADPRLASPSVVGAIWTATDDVGHGYWSTNLTPQNVSVSNITAARALVVNASQQVTNAATTSAALDNFFAMGITTIVASAGIGIGTNGGALVITNTGATTVSNAVIANLYGKGTNTSFYGIVTGATVRATNLHDSSNVKFWGAVGDGTNDDSAAFQLAVNAAATNLAGFGAKVTIDSGRYKITAQILVPANVTLVGSGMRSARLESSFSGFAFKFGTNSALSYGCGISDCTIYLSHTTGGAIWAISTAGLSINNCYIEGVVSGGCTGIYLDGGDAASLYTLIDNVHCNHIKYGLHLGASGSSQTTSVTAIGLNMNADLQAGSIGIQNDAVDGEGPRFFGGNLERYQTAVKLFGNGTLFSGMRFEDNTLDVYIETNSTGNAFMNCLFLNTVSNLAWVGFNNNVFMGTKNVDSSPYPNRLYGDSTLESFSTNNIPLAVIGRANQTGTVFSVNTATSTNNFAMVNSNAYFKGNVGVRTWTPAAPLHVLGSETRLQANDAYLSFYSAAGTFLGFVQNNSAGSMSIYQLQAQPMLFSVNGDFRLSILPSGNVGVGTITPLDKFHVVGGIVQTNGGIWQHFSIGAPSAPAASTQGAVYWNDGTNICAVFRNAGGALSTNKLSMTAWP